MKKDIFETSESGKNLEKAILSYDDKQARGLVSKKAYNLITIEDFQNNSIAFNNSRQKIFQD